MKILALEHEAQGILSEQFKPYLKPEAARIWDLTQAGTLRETYFRQDRTEAVLIMECAGAEEAQEVLRTLPLVQAGLITFEIIPLIPYYGLARLFGKTPQTEAQ